LTSDIVRIKLRTEPRATFQHLVSNTLLLTREDWASPTKDLLQVVTNNKSYWIWWERGTYKVRQKCAEKHKLRLSNANS